MNAMRTPLALFVTLAFVAVAVGQTPPKTRMDILRYGVTGIGSPYIWGGGNWDPNDRSFGGADCSGFVSKCWSISRWTPYRVDLHGPSTAGYINTPGSDWYEVDRSDLIYGDAIVYRYNDNQSGHTYTYLSGDGWGEHEVYEACGTAYGIVHRWRTAYSAADIVKGIRRTNLIENVGVTEHIIETDDGAPYYADTGMTGSSQYDSHALGCTEGSGRYHWMDTVRAETCEYRPILPESGWYRIYVTCNEGSPNVHDVGVTVNHAQGSVRYLWDQADPDGLNAWTRIGDRFYFEAGSSGSVMWDDFDAWPTDSDYVFRGDAVKFVLDNRVTVDGVGDAPGTFATLSTAIAWLRDRSSEEPDIIDITCDTLYEPTCVELDVWDDLTINGDADGNGVSATVIITPSAPVDWSTPCGMYLNVPIQHAYTLRDLVLIPQYVSAGYAVGAHGLVLDEQNPSGQASNTQVTLENITIAGSLPGNVATAADTDSRASATMFGGVSGAYDAAVLQRPAGWAGDDACRQTVNATNLTVTHSATTGLILTAAYTEWRVTGGLRLTYNGANGLTCYYIGESMLQIDATSGVTNEIADNAGYGITNLDSSSLSVVQVENCTIRGNNGGVASANTQTNLTNCVIADNIHTGTGGGVWQIGGVVSLLNCTLANNFATSGGSAIFCSSGTMSLVNSIVWGHGDTPLGGALTANYCNIEGGFTGAGNMNADPMFVDAAAGDYHLQRNSPCLNEADPSYEPQPAERDIDGQTRVLALRLDIGADEVDFWDGDADHDGDVDAIDLAALYVNLAGPEIAPPSNASLAAFDVDADGDIDLRDVAAFRLR